MKNKNDEMKLVIPDGPIKTTILTIAQKRKIPWEEVALAGLEDWTASCGKWLTEDDTPDEQPEFPSELERVAAQCAHAHA